MCRMESIELRSHISPDFSTKRFPPRTTDRVVTKGRKREEARKPFGNQESERERERERETTRERERERKVKSLPLSSPSSLSLPSPILRCSSYIGVVIQ